MKKALASTLTIQDFTEYSSQRKKILNPTDFQIQFIQHRKEEAKSYGIYKIVNKITCVFNNATRYKVTVRKEVAFCY